MAEQIASYVRPSRSPLSGATLPSVSGIATLSEASVTARLNLRAAPTSIERLLQWSGLALPARINTARTTGARSVLRLGPDEWWILADGEAAADLTSMIAQSSGGIAHSLVDISERNAGLVISGAAVEDCLAALCPLPLSLAAFPVGRATRTLLGRAEVMLWRTDFERFHLETGRSFAAYVTGLVGAAMRDEAAIRKRGMLGD